MKEWEDEARNFGGTDQDNWSKKKREKKIVTTYFLFFGKFTSYFLLRVMRRKTKNGINKHVTLQGFWGSIVSLNSPVFLYKKYVKAWKDEAINFRLSSRAKKKGKMLAEDNV